MPSVLVVLACLALGGCHRGIGPPAEHRASPPTVGVRPRDPAIVPLAAAEAVHLLNRATFGATRQSLDHLHRVGVDRWLEQQLSAALADEGTALALRPYEPALGPPEFVLGAFQAPPKTSRGQARSPGGGGAAEAGASRAFRDRLKNLDGQALARSQAMAELTRYILSQNQLEQVMVDFWINHFNVFSQKAAVKVFASDYVERAIRPFALGAFEDLLVASAQHPAMLVYLDQDKSRKPGGRRGGLNENYARELLELHTLGVDGGYTQSDVEDTARTLTGYALSATTPEPPVFAFRARYHDRGKKTVLGRTFGPTRRKESGESEARELLAFLAHHPSTSRHLAHKLCAKFVSDHPPETCVTDAQRAFLESGGQVAALLRAVLTGRDFWGLAARGSKLKTPLEFVVSAARALGLTPDGTVELSRRLEELGQPLLQFRAPTGYPIDAQAWLGAGQMMQRLRFAERFARGADTGLTPHPGVTGVALEPGEVRRVAEMLFPGGPPEDFWLRVETLVGLPNGPKLMEGEAVAFFLSSAEFQRK